MNKFILVLALFLIVGIAGRNERFWYIELPLDDKDLDFQHTLANGRWDYEELDLDLQAQPNLIEIRIMNYPALYFYQQEVER